jgi:hypothetical protein
MKYITPLDHQGIRRSIHPSQKQIHIQPVSSPLYVACAISNPERYYTRYKHYQAFAKHMVESGVILYTVELALRDRHHEVTSPYDSYHIQLRSDSQLWHKENLQSIGVSHFPADWEYGACIDADFLMTRPDWVTETIHQLQHYHWVQLFSTYSNLMSNFQVTAANSMSGFVFSLKNNFKNIIPRGYYGRLGAPGGAWAFRRKAYDTVGGLLETCIIGSGDLHMAIGLCGIEDYKHQDLIVGTPEYLKSIKIWQERAKVFKDKIGYIDNHMVHFWHGNNKNRGYSTRTEILKDYQYNPYVDVTKDWQHVLNWTGNKPALEETVRQYFRSRSEDSTI